MSGLDQDALLAALVLAPATYSRNRFFHMYTDPRVRRVRRRASLLRSLVKQLAGLAPDAGIVELVDGGDHRLSYVVPALGLRRTTVLSPLELALVRYVLGRRGGPARAGVLAQRDGDERAVEAALQRLGPAAAEPRASQPPSP